MAGAGYKLFTTGSVLTAAEVNTYLQEQTVMVFADATARTTALSGVVAEGMLSYLKDTDVIQYYNGSSWTTVNTDQTPLTTKGDLFTYSTADARLAVGNNGETLVADNSQSTGLRWGNNYGFTAGKNKIINGDFNINQRGFSSTTSSVTYTFDRWLTDRAGGTATFSAQTFTAGTAPVTGYESTNFLRIVTSGQSASGDYAAIDQRIENVRTLPNTPVTLSFWAKASTGTPKVGTSLVQNFGSGGSSEVITKSGDVTISSSWARYSVTVTMPSVSGKTIGSSSYIRTLLFTSAGSALSSYTDIGIQNVTIEIWGVQVELGSVATAFQTATGTLAGELGLCQRYYYRNAGGQTYSHIGFGMAYNTTSVALEQRLPVTMRVTPTSIEYSNQAINLPGMGNTALTSLTLASAESSPDLATLNASVSSGLTQYRPYFLVNNNNTAGYVGFNAEL